MRFGEEILKKHSKEFKAAHNGSIIDLLDVLGIDDERAKQLLDVLQLSILNKDPRVSVSLEEVLREVKTPEELILVSVKLGEMITVNMILGALRNNDVDGLINTLSVFVDKEAAISLLAMFLAYIDREKRKERYGVW